MDEGKLFQDGVAVEPADATVVLDLFRRRDACVEAMLRDRGGLVVGDDAL